MQSPTVFYIHGWPCTPLGFTQVFQSPSRDTCPIIRSLSRKKSQTTALSSWGPHRIWICSHTQPLGSNLEAAVSVCSSTMHPNSLPDRQEWLQKETSCWKRWVPAMKKTKWHDTGQVETAFQKQYLRIPGTRGRQEACFQQNCSLFSQP